MLVHSYLSKVQRLVLVLNKLERAYINSGTRQTDFEIVGADKRNPTTLSLKPVAKAKAYDPAPALKWSIQQIDAVSHGNDPDPRVDSEIALDLVKLSTKDSEYGYKAFWINGHAEAVKFDDVFCENARRIARQRIESEAPNRWRIGVSQGSVVGELKKVDGLEGDNLFVVVPPIGPDRVVCTFPENMRNEMGQYLFKVVRVVGNLHYSAESPFPFKVEALGIEPVLPRRKPMKSMIGLFAGQEQVPMQWGDLLHG
ncbi:hypothetical protein ASG67_04695 [Sphingomonas sp. Leaf339]|nr:hypothetical protein ASG67_04695 [Sphingomonas sp. Leaf339]